MIPIADENASDPFAQSLEGIGHIAEFRLEKGLPVWKYEFRGIVIEKRVVLPHHQNTTHVTYRVVSGPWRVRLQLRPAVHFRPHDAPVNTPVRPYSIKITQDGYEISTDQGLPTLRLFLYGQEGAFTVDRR